MSKTKLEYVFSGTGHTRMFDKHMTSGPTEGNRIIRETYRRIQGLNGHTYSALFNAHTERNFGRLLNEHYADTFYKVHSDSGGLQIITQGLDITEEMKQTVYETQRDYSDIAMSFDEIPVIISGGTTSNRNDTTLRKFDVNNFEDYARRTGMNVANQLRTFAEDPSGRSKPLIIIQGNCLDTYCRWAEIMMEMIPSELHSGIGGISLGAAGLGTGDLEDIERMFIFNELPMPDEAKSTLHILGVGALRRLLPMVTFRQNGLLDGVHISYDSTSHSSGISLGNYYCDKKNTLVKLRTDIFESVADEIRMYTETDMSNDIIWDSLHMNNNDFFTKHPHGVTERFVAITGFLVSSITNFTRSVNAVDTDISEYNKFVELRKLYHYNSLLKVKTRTDFEYWMAHVGRHVKSNRIGQYEEDATSLEDFFL